MDTLLFMAKGTKGGGGKGGGKNPNFPSRTGNRLEGEGATTHRRSNPPSQMTASLLTTGWTSPLQTT